MYGLLNSELFRQCWGDLYASFDLPYVLPILVLSSVLAGMTIGYERRTHRKPAGLRTLSMICLGAAIYTIASILIAGDNVADRGRIAAQVVSGIGFLGAGVIIREHGSVQGLTTGATIWAVAAIGVLIGSGYALLGLVLSLVMLTILTLFRADEDSDDEPNHTAGQP